MTPGRPSSRLALYCLAPMPDWIENELTVSGERAEVAEFIEAIKGIDSDGDELPLSLNVIDPMPREYASGKSYRDSDEYRGLMERFDSVRSESRDAVEEFALANPGFVVERAAEIDGLREDDG